MFEGMPVWRVAPLAVACLCFATQTAISADVTVRTSLTESLTADSNYQMSSAWPGMTYISATTLWLNTVVRTPTSRFEGTAEATYRTYFGDGSDNLIPGIDRNFLGRYTKTFETATVSLEGARQYRQASFVQLAETGQNTVGGDVITSWVGSTVTHRFGPLDDLTLNSRATRTDFSGPTTGTPFSDITSTAAWRHRLTPLTELTPTAQFEAIDYDNATDTKVRITRAFLGGESRLTKRLKVRGSYGYAFVSLDQDSVAQGLFILPGASGTAVGWIGDMLLSYDLTARNEFDLSAARSVAPDTLGNIRKVDIVGATLTHKLDSAAALTFSAQYSHQVGVSAKTELYSAGVSYTLDLMRDWHLSLSYRYRYRENTQVTSLFVEDTATASANVVLLTLKYDAVLLSGGMERSASPPAGDPIAMMASPGEWVFARPFAMSSGP